MSFEIINGTRFLIGSPITELRQPSLMEDEYIEIGEIKSFGKIGDEAIARESDKFVDYLMYWRRKRSDYAVDGGILTINLARDDEDNGQIFFREALKFKLGYDYNFKLEYRDDNVIRKEIYFQGLPLSAVDQNGGIDTVLETVFQIAVNSEPMEP